MFGIVVSGRPVITEGQAVSQTQFAFSIPAVPSFSHIVVFLLPSTTLPPDTAAAVYVQLPTSTEFKLLGAIANEKQSAVFKINNSGASINSGFEDDAMMDEPTPTPGPNGNVTLGISVEPVAQISVALANLKQNANAMTTINGLVKAQPGPSPVSTKVLAQRIIGNAFNFLASFAGSTGPGGQEVIPLKSFQDWWTKFEKKIDLDPSFLERADQG
ncbi:DUF775 domain protein [Patellaria atrata CBS 101060]|uniref:DUF775 domain protein n=1 Tax=Patellaria atrata CBS 101060 TaxID=1346257 RepID=A0A9P4SA70_9PEZI|nr:DUF775 domain protein [Patellaria atrata CBS 101060]